jgi:predicted transcriptional regulator
MPMTTIDKNGIMELEILKHVETSPRLSNRMVASKLGCSVKLAHALLGKLVDRGLLHVKKLHSRRWDYFITPSGISEKARLTYEFLDFSFHFYQDARKASSAVCRNLAEAGATEIAFLGAGDLAEIVYLGVKEWNLTLYGVFDDCESNFLGHNVLPISQLANSKADAVIVCLYDRTVPTSMNYLPDGVERLDNMRWIFGESPALASDFVNKNMLVEDPS